MATKEQVIEFIKGKYSASEIAEKVDDQMSEYVSEETLNDFDGDTFEAYCETCNKEAEHDILREVVQAAEVEFPEQITEDLQEDIRAFLTEWVSIDF